jgi:hypothetical protein
MMCKYKRSSTDVSGELQNDKEEDILNVKRISDTKGKTEEFHNGYKT